MLGVGAAVTLAAWNDSEFATGLFTAGSFEFQGASEADQWEDHAVVGDAASLTLSTGADNLTPGDVVYAPFALKVTGTSSASVTTIAPVLGSGTLVAGDLSFDAVTTGSTFGCDSTAFGAGTALATNFTMAPDDEVNLCLKITAQPGLAQGHSGNVVWQWDAVSN